MDQDNAGPMTPPPVMREPPPLAAPRPAPAAAGAIFTPDLPGGPDALGHEAALAPLAELIAHVGARPPLSIGIFGGPGAGKSGAAVRLAARASALASAAGRAGSTRFLTRLVTLRISAADIAGDPAPAIASALHAALVAPAADGTSYAALAADAAREAVDPHVAARQAMELLDSARDRLDIERKGLDDLEARKARLVDAILFETAGSRIDGYARANRASIEARLRAFGFEGEPIASFKDLAREAAEHPGFVNAMSAFLRATWAYRGQGRLLAWSAILFFLAQGCDVTRDNSDAWLRVVRGLGDQAAPIANWLETHLSWFQGLRQICNALIVVLLATNIVRAIRFLTPVRRGARLLASDIETRRGQVDAAVSHQTRRVDSLSRQVESLAAEASEAETRAAARPTPGVSAMASPYSVDDDSPVARARTCLSFVAAAMARGDAAAPRRIVIIIDDLDTLAPARAAEIIEASVRLLARDGFVAIVAADPTRLANAWGGPAETADRLDRLIQIPVCLPDAGLDGERISAFARTLLTNAPIAAPAIPDPAASALDAPLKPVEGALVATLAPLAACSPRAAKRFINVYRLARGRASDTGALALMLALDSGGTAAELGAMSAAMDAAPDAPLAIGPDQPRLAFALAAANKARGNRLTVADARIAWTIARDYRMPL